MAGTDRGVKRKDEVGVTDSVKTQSPRRSVKSKVPQRAVQSKAQDRLCRA